MYDILTARPPQTPDKPSKDGSSTSFLDESAICAHESRQTRNFLFSRRRCICSTGTGKVFRSLSIERQADKSRDLLSKVYHSSHIFTSLLFNVPKVSCLTLIIDAFSPAIRVQPSSLSPLTKGIQPQLIILWSCFHVFRRFPLATTCLCVVEVYSTFRILHLEPCLFGSLRLPFLHPS